MRINQNIAAMNAYRNVSQNGLSLSKSLEKLSSGFRINRAADDAAGLSISEGLRSQVGGFKMAIQNSQEAISLIQTAEGALTEVHTLLQRVRDLAVQSANVGANDTVARAALGDEVTAAVAEIDRIGQATAFGSKQLLNANQVFTFHVGQAGGTINQVTVRATLISAAQLTLANVATDIRSGAGANALATLDAAIDAISTQRSGFGAVQNRLEATVRSLGVAVENLAASESRIRDTDMADEMVKFTRAQILQQAGTSMLAQANAAPQSVLSLLRG